MYHAYERLYGKTISEIETDRWDELLIIRFTDGSSWVIIPERFNCAGAVLLQKFIIKDDPASVPEAR
jgi:hypothetical protein